MNLMKPVCKEVFRVESVGGEGLLAGSDGGLVTAVRKAFHCAGSGVPGPVFVELPINILYSPLTIMWQLGLLERMTKGEVLGADASFAVVIPHEFRHEEKLKGGVEGGYKCKVTEPLDT